MILRSIEVKGWRCFPDKVRLGRLSERLNVVYGPNGAGKSTFFEAMVRGFFDYHRVGGEFAEMLRPWGKALAPGVVLEFCHAGQEYRLSKQFLDHPSASLERLEGAAFVSLAEGEAADEQVRQVLRASGPGRGLAQVKNWGLAQVLWTLQGDLNLGEITNDTAADIRSMLGAQFAGLGGGRIEQEIERRYAEYFTKGGAVKKGQHAPAAVRLEEDLKAAEIRRGEAREALRQFEERSSRLEGIRAERAQLAREIEAASGTLVEARRRAQEYAELTAEQQRRRGQSQAGEADYKRIVQQIEAIQAAAADLSKACGDRDTLFETLPRLRRAASEARAEAIRRKTLLENCRAGQSSVDAALAEAAQAGTYAAALLCIAELAPKLKQIQRVSQQVTGLRTDRARLVAPDKSSLKKIVNSAKTRDEAQLRLEAALIQIEIEPSRDLVLTVVEGEEPGPGLLHSGDPTLFRGSPAVVLEIEGLGRLRARGPASDAGVLRQDRDKAADKLARLTEPYGTLDLDALEKLSELASDLDRRADEEQARLDGLLAGKSADSLLAELAKRQVAATTIEAQRPGWKEAPPDAPALEFAAGALGRQFREEVGGAERLWQNTENLAASAETNAATGNARLEETEKRAAGAEERLRKLRADGRTDAERESERLAAAASWDAARASLQAIGAQLEVYAGDPAPEATLLERQLKALDQRERETLQNEKLEEGTLSETAARGPYQALAVAEEEVAALTASLAREKSHMDSVALLWRTVRECRTRAVAAVAAPIEDAATTMLHRIAGGRLGRIRLGEGLVPADLTIEAAQTAVPLDTASGGEREQIFLATRLALADVLTRDERQLVLLDDVLTATDSARMARILRLLEESADRTQIVILTCHRERYLGLDGAEFFNVEQIAAARRAVAR